MVNVKYQKDCALCRQSVEIEGFSILSDSGRLYFCCAGCLSIYKLLFANETALSYDRESNESNTSNNKTKK